jgi:hypothetical protein
MFTSTWLRVSLLVLGIGASAHLTKAQDIVGEWRGTRSERNAITGGTFTVDFTFQFAGSGEYRETARLGGAVVLKLTGRYALAPGGKPGDRTVTHILELEPRNLEVRPSRQELQLLQMADLPNVERTQQYVTFFNVAPAGGMSLENAAGGESWGLKRVP